MSLVRITFGDLFIEPYPQHPRSYFQRWLAGKQKFFDNLDDEILAAIASVQVDNASGTDLNHVGADFGRLGRRRGRGDTDYRNHIKRIVNAYEGDGTLGAIRFAVSNAVLADEGSVRIDQHYADLEYTLTLSEWEAHEVGTVWELADIADPSVVEQRDLIYDCGDATIEIAPEEATQATNIHESPDAQILLEPTETAVDMDADRGFGSDLLDGEDELGR